MLDSWGVGSSGALIGGILVAVKLAILTVGSGFIALDADSALDVS